MTKGGSIILRIYFALVSFVTLMILIFSVADAINIGLRTYVFPLADRNPYPTYCETMVPAIDEKIRPIENNCEEQTKREEEANQVQKQRDLIRDISMLLVSLPLFLIHFRIVYRDWKDEKESKA